jgi:hypothetical protein
MPHPCGRFRRQQVAGRPVEELEYGGVLERGSVRHVDHHGRSRHGIGESLAGDRVDARARRRRDRLVAVLAELGDELRSDEPAAADDSDLHAAKTGQGRDS